MSDGLICDNCDKSRKDEYVHGWYELKVLVRTEPGTRYSGPLHFCGIECITAAASRGFGSQQGERVG